MRANAQADPEKPVTPPDSYRVVMENDRMRMIEIHIKARSKVNVDSPAGRERFLYMLSDGALVLAPPGKTPYEFALHAGETAVFPAVSPTVENDTDPAVRALMVEIKTPMRSAPAAAAARANSPRASRACASRPNLAATKSAATRSAATGPSGKSSAARSQSQSQSKQVAKSRSPRRARQASPMRRSICATPMPDRPRR